MFEGEAIAASPRPTIFALKEVNIPSAVVRLGLPHVVKQTSITESRLRRFVPYGNQKKIVEEDRYTKKNTPICFDGTEDFL